MKKTFFRFYEHEGRNQLTLYPKYRNLYQSEWYDLISNSFTFIRRFGAAMGLQMNKRRINVRTRMIYAFF